MGKEHGLIEVYDSQLKLTAAYGEPVSSPEHIYQAWYTSSDGIFAISLLDKGSFRFYVFDRSSKLMFEPEKVKLRGFSTMRIFPRQDLIVLEAEKMVEGKRRPDQYLMMLNIKGQILSPGKVLSTVLNINSQVSDNGRYLRAYNKDFSYLLSRNGELFYSLFTSSWDEVGAGQLTDEGVFIGFMSKWQNLVVVDRDGNVEELPIPKPKKVRAFDAKRGLILSRERDAHLVYRYVQRRIPAELLAEVHRKGGLK